MRNALFRVDKVNHGKTSLDSWNPWKHEPSSVFTPSSRCSTSPTSTEISGNISMLFPKFSGFSHAHPFSIIHLEYLQLTTFANPFIGRVSRCRRPLAARIFEVGILDHRSLNRWETMGFFWSYGISMVLKIWVPQNHEFQYYSFV